MRLTTAIPSLLLPSILLSQPSPRVDSIFGFANDSTPGCAVAAVRDGVTLHARGYGSADLEHGVPITSRTPFYLASVSKQFTAAAIGQLVADGRLSLDDDVRKYVPELPSYGSAITVRQLLHHTSGLRDYLALFSLADLDDFPITNSDFLDMLRRQRATNFAPGTQYSYSNSGYVLLSIVVERATNQPLRAFAQERVFAPLGMAATTFRDRHTTLIAGRALAYEHAGNEWITSVPAFDVVGDGGLFSTVEDLARWEGRTLGPFDVARGRLADGSTLTYGAGLMWGTYRGDSIVEHGGSYGGYNTHLLRFPKRRFSVAVLCNGNQLPASLLAQRVVDVYLGDSLAAPGLTQAPRPTAMKVAAIAPERWAGTYFDDRAMTVRRLVARDGALRYVRGPNNESELLPLGPGRFVMRGTTVTVALSAQGDTMRVDGAGLPAPMFRRVPPPTPHDPSDYSSAYTSAELNVTCSLLGSDSTLIVRSVRGNPVRMLAVFDDAFSLGALFVRFTRDANGRVTGMLVSAGERARNVRFERR